jgi:hypothetical protein
LFFDKFSHFSNELLIWTFRVNFSMEGSDICFEVVRRAVDGFVYSEAVAWWDIFLLPQTFQAVQIISDSDD